MTATTRFSGFGEAARVYAEHAHVVEAMYEALCADLLAFFQAVSAEAKRRSPAITDESSSQYHYWCIAAPGGLVPCLQWAVDDPAVVHACELRMTAVCDKATPKQCAALAALATDPRFLPHCQPSSGGPWRLFRVVLPLRGTEPIDTVAEFVASLLTAMAERLDNPS